MDRFSFVMTFLAKFGSYIICNGDADIKKISSFSHSCLRVCFIWRRLAACRWCLVLVLSLAVLVICCLVSGGSVVVSSSSSEDRIE